MKTNKYTDLIKFGLTQKTLMSLNESEINTLHKNLIEGKKAETKEQSQPTVVNKTVKQVVLPPGTQTTVGNVSVSNQGGKTTVTPTTEGEMSETKETEGKKDSKYNPWAICHAQVGPKKTRKFERCVQAVKKSISEGKDPFSVILENKIVSLLEKHIQPKMNKKELLDLIGNNKMEKPIGKIGSLGVMEDDTKTAPTKPGTKNPPKPAPFDPFKPKPGTNPNPKAKKTEDNPEFIPLRKIEIGRRWKEDDNKKKKDGDKKKEERIFRPSNKIETFEANDPKTAPTKPGTKTPPKPAPFDPFKPKPGTNPNPKAKSKKTETKEQAESPTIAPTKPTTKPGTKNPPKPAPFDPFKPKPGTNPNPKAKTKKSLPSWLKFNNLGLNLK
jgi:hypothetical protein